MILFKEKTADEMRISDWSSDVCSFALSFVTVTQQPATRRQILARGLPRTDAAQETVSQISNDEQDSSLPEYEAEQPSTFNNQVKSEAFVQPAIAENPIVPKVPSKPAAPRLERSEESSVGKEGVSRGRSRWSP